MKRGPLLVALAGLLVILALVLTRLLSPEQRPTRTAPTPAEPERVKVTRNLMSTWVTVITDSPDPRAAARAVQAAFTRMVALEQQLSRFVPESDVSRINGAPAGTPVAVGQDTWRVLQDARVAWEQTDGVFDVTVEPLIELWRRAGESGRLPTDDELAQARARVGFDKVRLIPPHPPAEGRGGGEARDEVTGGGQVVLVEPGMSIDLGGLAKGYVAEEAVEVLRAAGLTSALVEAGGDICTLGRRGDGQPWVTAVRNPETEDGWPFIALLRVADGAVATSGSYARYVEIEGKRYTHVLDPRTGWPETTVTSATVIGPEATSADWLATTLTVLGPAEGIELIEFLAGYECLIVTGHGAQRTLSRSSGFAAYEQ